MGMRGSETGGSGSESLLAALRRGSGVETTQLLADAKAAARESLIRTTMRNGSPPYPLLRRLWQFERVREYVTGDSQDDAETSLRDRLRLWRRGFEAGAETLYDFDRYPPAAYVSDYEYWVPMYYLNEPWTEAIDNKLFFHWMLAPFDEHRMDVYGLLEDGSFHPLAETDERDPPSPDRVAADGAAISGERPSLVHRQVSRPAGERVLDYLREEDRLVLKHATGAWGTEVLTCELRDGTPRIDGDPLDEEAFRRRVAALDGYLVCEFVEQAEYSNRLYPGATNTIRVMTMWDDDAGEAFVPVAYHRMGTAESAPIDNMHSGGLGAKIDVETGELGAAIATNNPRYSGRRIESHPETGRRIEGTSVPGWEQIRDAILGFADNFPFVPYVGWDVVVTGPGEFTVIEANNHATIRTGQMYEPLLKDERTRRFFVSNGVITEERATAVAEALDQSSST